ncbi:MAG: N-formylglutamate deformylase [Burkholderiales bacterium]
MELFRYQPGSSPLVVSIPHVGTHIPPGLATRMTPAALRLPDTDWHLDRLYNFLAGLDPTVLMATHSRFVIDLNRPPDNQNLYPGQDTTALVPVDCGDRSPIYLDEVPDQSEIEARRARYWNPYHHRLESALQETKARHGYALLWDAHSIRSELPRFFDGPLPDLNLGTADGRSCGAGLGEHLLAIARGAPTFSSVLNGRYKGGHITRHFGCPSEHIHAVQLELSWATYMDEDYPFAFRDELAAGVRPVLKKLLTGFIEWGAAAAR